MAKAKHKKTKGSGSSVKVSDLEPGKNPKGGRVSIDDTVKTPVPSGPIPLPYPNRSK